MPLWLKWMPCGHKEKNISVFVILHYNAGLKSPLHVKKKRSQERQKWMFLKKVKVLKKNLQKVKVWKKVVDTGGGINRQPFLISNDDTTKKEFFAAFFPL